MVNNVWIVTYESVPDRDVTMLGVYAEFEAASARALKAAHQQVQEYKVHTEAQARIDFSATDGLATYTIYGHYYDNPDYPWDVYEIRRHEVIE